MSVQPCLYCGGDAASTNHLLRCVGPQEPAPVLEVPYQAPYAAGRETSEAAGRSIEPTAESLCGRILAGIKSSHAIGLTCDEVEELWALKHQTASARLWDLHTRGLIHDSGVRRATSSGRKAVVWVA